MKKRLSLVLLALLCIVIAAPQSVAQTGYKSTNVIVAVMDGRVLSTRYDGGFGRTICMEHRDNFFTRYAHCDVILVKDGDFIRKGQLIGLVGSTGTSTGNHLHFEIRYNDIPLNPLDFLPYKENLRHMHKFRNWN